MKKLAPLPKKLLHSLVSVWLLPVFVLAVTTTPELPNPGTARGLNKQQQEQMGLQAMAQVYQQMPVLPDSSPITQYVQQLGKKLVTVIPAQNSWPYQFHVVQEKDINAFALPGGPIFINSGTIQAADNEAELAGVMSHEMSHVYMQHSAKQASSAMWEQGLLGILGAVIPNGTVGSLAKAGIQIGAGLVSLKYSRGDEAQADAVGAIIMYKAGYNPKAMAEFFQKLESQGGAGAPQFLSDHPDPGNRVAAVTNEIKDWPPKNYLGSSQAFATARRESNSVKAYTAQEIAQGAKNGTWARQNQKNDAAPASLPSTSGGAAAASGNIANLTLKQVQPSSSFTQFQQNGMSISYPRNWQAASRQDGGVLIAPAAGVAQNAIAYGVSINAAQDSGASTLDQATQDLVNSMQQSNPGLRPSDSAQRIRVNGTSGRSVTLLGTSPVEQDGKPVAEQDWLVTLPYPQGGILYLVFTAPQKDFGHLRSTYKRMLQSLKVQ